MIKEYEKKLKELDNLEDKSQEEIQLLNSLVALKGRELDRDSKPKDIEDARELVLEAFELVRLSK